MQDFDFETDTNGFAARLLFGIISRMRRRLTGGEESFPPITALTRKAAILEIFRNHWADDVGTRLSLAALMAAWTEVGLRADDLANGLNELLDDGSLRLHPNYFKPAVTLTRRGKDWLDGVGVDPKVLAEEKRVLEWIQERKKNHVPEELKPGEIPHWRIVDRRVKIAVEQD